MEITNKHSIKIIKILIIKKLFVNLFANDSFCVILCIISSIDFYIVSTWLMTICFFIFCNHCSVMEKSAYELTEITYQLLINAE